MSKSSRRGRFPGTHVEIIGKLMLVPPPNPDTRSWWQKWWKPREVRTLILIRFHKREMPAVRQFFKKHGKRPIGRWEQFEIPFSVRLKELEGADILIQFEIDPTNGMLYRQISS